MDIAQIGAIITKQQELISRLVEKVEDLEKKTTEPETVKELKEYLEAQKKQTETASLKELSESIVNQIL